MAYQANAFQTSSSRAYQLSLADTLALGTVAGLASLGPLTATRDLFLPVDSEFNPGGPTAVVVRFRIFARQPRSFPAIAPGENEALAEPVIFFHKDAQVNLDFTILNPDGTAYNLTGATVDLLAQPERGAALTFPCSVIDAANGKARRTVAANDFAAGAYQAQLKVTAGAVVFHSVYFRILIGKAIE